MRILYHSAAPWVNTGYGRVTRELATRLQNAGHEIAIQPLSSVQGGAVKWNGEVYDGDSWDTPVELDKPIPVFPSNSSKNKDFGISNVRENYSNFDADWYFTHFDTWMKPARENIPEMEIPYSSYVIVDHYPAPEAVKRQVANAKSTIAMSKFAKYALGEKGVRADYIPHGVDTDTYRPLDPSSENYPDKLQYADNSGELQTIDLDERFVVGMVAANHGDRKNIPNHLSAFKRFVDEVDDEAIIYVHTQQNASHGFNLRDVQEQIGLPDENIKWADPELYHNIGDEELNQYYNMFDVLVNCSMGESWGLTITEAMSTETPAIVTDFSSMPEQVGGLKETNLKDTGYDGVKEANRGLVVEPNSPVWRERVSSKQYLVNPERIFHALEYYYENQDLLYEHGKRARAHVKHEYDWENSVVPAFIEHFDNLEEVYL